MTKKSKNMNKHTPAPIWYTQEEMYYWLISEKYSIEVAKELSDKFAASLQSSFEKGFEKGLHLVSLGIARKMMKEGYSIEKILRISGLSEDDLRKYGIL
jgi:predicted transposase/invertase (TIGR01784 family)